MIKKLIIFVVVAISDIASYSLGYEQAKKETQKLQKSLELDIQRVVSAK